MADSLHLPLFPFPILSPSKRAFEKYKLWGLFSEFYGILIHPCLFLYFKPSFNILSVNFYVSLRLVAVHTVWISINFVTPLSFKRILLHELHLIQAAAKITPEILEGRLMVEASFRQLKLNAKDLHCEVVLSIRLVGKPSKIGSPTCPLSEFQNYLSHIRAIFWWTKRIRRSLVCW